MGRRELWELGFKSIKSLEVERGILASGREEVFGCVFGRDSLVTALILLTVDRRQKAELFFPLVKRILHSLGDLQGKESLLESGEEPGKIIHEYRPDRHEHLTVQLENPWYVYPDGAMRNYDSVDATPLFLMALYRYVEASGDRQFLREMLPSARRALDWLLSFDDRFIAYSFSPERTFGGLRTQSWMDSSESIFYEENTEVPPYPIAPLEVQAYAWSAFRMWGKELREVDPDMSATLEARAGNLKRMFNNAYVLHSSRFTSLAFAIDGDGKKLVSPRSSMGHVLFAAFEGESVLDAEYIPGIVDRLLARDLFVEAAGIRTLSSRSKKYDPLSYHNGSIWPHDTAILAEGFEMFGYVEEASRVRGALLRSYVHFRTPIELFGYKRGLREYRSPSGQGACRTQAWSAAGLLATVAASKE